MSTVTKKEITNFIWSQMQDAEKPLASQITENFLKIVAEGLERDGVVKIPSFGNFEVYETKPRIVRNPKTGETMNKDRQKTVKFRVSKKLKEALNQIPEASEPIRTTSSDEAA